MRHIMKHAVIVSGGNINTDFALDFLKKNTDENTLKEQGLFLTLR